MPSRPKRAIPPRPGRRGSKPKKAVKAKMPGGKDGKDRGWQGNDRLKGFTLRMMVLSRLNPCVSTPLQLCVGSTSLLSAKIQRIVRFSKTLSVARIALW